MSVVALKPYEFPSADAVETFHGHQVLYVCWDQHLMFGAPFAFSLPPSTPFGDLVREILPASYGYHPDFGRIDWSRVQWFKSGKPWYPDPGKSLADNGLRHKDALRFRTPGLDGIQGSCS